MIGVVKNLHPTVNRLVDQQDIIVFDGKCVLCSRFFKFMLRYDHEQRFQFATAQSQLGQQLYSALDLPTDTFETNLVIVDGQIFGYLDAFSAAMTQIGWPWRLLSGLKYLPKMIKMPLYHVIARNRFRVFGRFNQCMIPNPELRARFMPDGF